MIPTAPEHEFAPAAALGWALLEALVSAYPEPRPEDALPSSAEGERRDEALVFLRATGLITLWHKSGTLIARAAAAGVQAVESAPGYDPSLRAYAALLRLLVLQALAWGEAKALNEPLIIAALNRGYGLDLPPEAVHRALAYLVDVSLAEWTDRGQARITEHGCAYLFGRGPEVAGVATPGGR